MRLKRRVIDEATDPRLLPDMLIKTLNNLDGEALVLAPGEQPIFASVAITSSARLRSAERSDFDALTIDSETMFVRSTKD